MSGKLIFLLLALSCVAQGHATRAPRSDAELRLTIDEVVKALNELIAKLREALGGLGGLIQEIEERIKNIISAVDIPGIIAEIQKRIEDIIKAAGINTSAAAACLKAEKEAVGNLTSSVANGVAECVKIFDPIKSQIHQQIADITADATDVITGITGGIAKCFKDHPLNPIKLYECVKGLVQPNTDKVNAIITKIGDAIDADQKLIADASTQLTKCSQDVAADANSKKEAIIDEFQKCVDEIVN